MTKLTNDAVFAYILENFAMPEDYRIKVEAMRASNAKKTANRKPTKSQLAEAEVRNKIKTAILEALSVDTFKSLADLQAEVPTLADYTPQKLAPQITALIKEGKAIRDDKKALYKRI